MRDLQSAAKISNEGLEISYTMPNFFVLSLSQSVWWGKELVGNLHNYSGGVTTLCGVGGHGAHGNKGGTAA